MKRLTWAILAAVVFPVTSAMAQPLSAVDPKPEDGKTVDLGRGCSGSVRPVPNSVKQTGENQSVRIYTLRFEFHRTCNVSVSPAFDITYRVKRIKDGLLTNNYGRASARVVGPGDANPYIIEGRLDVSKDWQFIGNAYVSGLKVTFPLGGGRPSGRR